MNLLRIHESRPHIRVFVRQFVDGYTVKVIDFRGNEVVRVVPVGKVEY